MPTPIIAPRGAPSTQQTVPKSSVSKRISVIFAGAGLPSPPSSGNCGASVFSRSRRMRSIRCTISLIRIPVWRSSTAAPAATTVLSGRTKSAEDQMPSARLVSGPRSFRLRRKPRARVGNCGTSSAHCSSVRRAPMIVDADTGGTSAASS